MKQISVDVQASVLKTAMDIVQEMGKACTTEAIDYNGLASKIEAEAVDLRGTLRIASEVFENQFYAVCVFAKLAFNLQPARREETLQFVCDCLEEALENSSNTLDPAWLWRETARYVIGVAQERGKHGHLSEKCVKRTEDLRRKFGLEVPPP